MKERTSTSSPASAASLSQPELMACEPSPCAKPTQDAKPSSPKPGRESRSGRTLEPSTWVSPSATDEVRGSLPPRPQDTGIPLNQQLASAWPTPDKSAESGGRRGKNPGQNREDGSKRSIPVSELIPASGSLPLAFPASQPAGPGSNEARMMTAGSGKRLLRSLQPSDPLGPFLKILLESKTYSSTEFNLKWTTRVIPLRRWERWLTVMDEAFSVKRWQLSKRKDTPSKYSVFLLAPSMPRTGGCDTGLFASAWPTARAQDTKSEEWAPGKLESKMEESRGQPLPRVLKANWPTPRSEDSESTGAHRGTPDTLTSAAKAAWATPKGAEAGPDLAKADRSKTGMALPAQAHGPATSGCLARTEKFVVRLMILSAWLMGYQWSYLKHWARKSKRNSKKATTSPRIARSSVRSATQLSGKSRRKSSAQ